MPQVALEAVRLLPLAGAADPQRALRAAAILDSLAVEHAQDSRLELAAEARRHLGQGARARMSIRLEPDPD